MEYIVNCIDTLEKENKEYFNKRWFIFMENINYKGVNGVFIPNNEFEYIKRTISENNFLMQKLIKEYAKENPDITRCLINL